MFLSCCCNFTSFIVILILTCCNLANNFRLLGNLMLLREQVVMEDKSKYYILYVGLYFLSWGKAFELLFLFF